MKVHALLRRWLPRLHLPFGVLLVLLQRTPAARVWSVFSESVLASRAGEVLRAVGTLAALGALHSRAGATTFVLTPSNPVPGTVGSRLDVAFTYTGTPSSPARFQVTGALPAGLSFVPAPIAGTIRSGTPVITGTPTQAGTFSVSVQGFNADGLTNNVQHEIRFVISGGVTTTAPTISTHPQAQTVAAGGAVTFTVQAAGSPAPTFQWTRDGAMIANATAASLTLASAQSVDAGNYAVVVSNSAGSVTSNPARLTVTSGTTGVKITTQPVSQMVAGGGTVVFNVGATGGTGFQWRRNGNAIPGATGATLVISGATALAHDGMYTVAVTGASGSETSNAADLMVMPGADFGRLVNLSILTTISNTDPVFTLGTVIGGTGTSGTKPLLIRAAGPALVQLGVTGALPDPKLEVFAGAIVSTSNDDWGGASSLTSAFSQVGAFAYASPASKDAASFNPLTATGAYTVQVSGVGGAAGAVIAELYDASTTNAVTAATPRLVNVSVLKQISAGTVLTAGFVIGGGEGSSKTVLIRAIGPTLAAAPFNVGGAMADPKLELFSGQAVIAGNDNWAGDAQLTAVGNSVGAFAITNLASRDAILLVSLAPGNYTAQVSGVGGGGVALVEVYEVP